MQTEILLKRISFEQLEESIKTIVSKEIQKSISDLTSTLLSNTTPKLLTRKETAGILGISLPTLHEWTKAGLLPAKRINASIRYEKNAVFNALDDVVPLRKKCRNKL